MTQQNHDTKKDTMKPELSRRAAKAIQPLLMSETIKDLFIKALESADTYGDLPEYAKHIIRLGEMNPTAEPASVPVAESILHTPPAAKALEATLVKKKRDVIDAGLQNLAEIPTVAKNKDDQELIAVPWTIVPRPKIEKTEWEHSQLRSVEIQDLFASQPYLVRDTVAWHLRHAGEMNNDKNSFPNVLRNMDGQRLIYDGHHRLAAWWLIGAEVANVWYLREQDL